MLNPVMLLFVIIARFTRARIETKNTRKMNPSINIARFTRARIETKRTMEGVQDTFIARFTRARIETESFLILGS
mgnify:CR=1 FL=1